MQGQIGISECRRVTSQFTEQFRGMGFIEEEPVPITSGVDPSVRLIGAPISVLKPYLGSDEHLERGLYLVQNCIRTHNLSSLLELDQPQEYGSFFTGLGALATTGQTERVFQATSEYLSSRLSIGYNDAFISVRGDDKDLLEAAENNGVYAVVPNFKEPSYYRHEYGLESVYGRNTSYWVRNQGNGQYEDIGNVIVIEGQDESLGTEFAFGDTTLIKQLSGLSHVTDAYDLRLVEDEAPYNLRIRFEDCVVTSMALLAEGLKPGAQNNQTRILRTYMKGVSLFRRLLDLDASALTERLESLEMGRLPFTARNAGKYIVSWLVDYELRTAREGASNKEDVIIADLLGRRFDGNIVDSK